MKSEDMALLELVFFVTANSSVDNPQIIEHFVLINDLYGAIQVASLKCEPNEPTKLEDIMLWNLETILL